MRTKRKRRKRKQKPRLCIHCGKPAHGRSTGVISLVIANTRVHADCIAPLIVVLEAFQRDERRKVGRRTHLATPLAPADARDIFGVIFDPAGID